MAHLKLEKPAGCIRNRPLKDYAGIRFGRLVGLRLVEREERQNNHRWAFRCDCGNEPVIRIKSVRSGHTSSCGCLFRDEMVKRNSTHGMCRQHPLTYRTWKDMRARCRNPRHKDFHLYGGRGIKVADRWGDFGAFFADMGERPVGHTIDRIDTNGNYEPGNCRWATSEVQANNKRNNSRIVYQGQDWTLQQWCRHFGLDHSKVRWRLAQGWSLDKVFQPGDFRIEP